MDSFFFPKVTLIVGVKADYPPFGFRSPSGEIVGIEPGDVERIDCPVTGTFNSPFAWGPEQIPFNPVSVWTISQTGAMPDETIFQEPETLSKVSAGREADAG